MTRILQSMERDGLISRMTAPDDKRVRAVRPTRAGRALCGPLTAAARPMVTRVERGSSESDLRITRRTLMPIVDNLP